MSEILIPFERPRITTVGTSWQLRTGRARIRCLADQYGLDYDALMAEVEAERAMGSSTWGAIIVVHNRAASAVMPWP